MEEEEEEERVWSWGAGSDGQLSTGRLDDELLPHPLRAFSSIPPISHIACGGAHAIALAGDKVLTWGRGTSGQLGHGNFESSLQPKFVTFFEGFVISCVSAGWNHSGFVSDKGRFFTCGDGSFGQLGHGDYKSHCSPMEVSFFCLKRVEQIACGMRHSLVLESGPLGVSVYGFGLGSRGQLGLHMDRTMRSLSLPQVIYGFEDVEIVSVSANGDHSAALSARGNVYTWGRGFSGTSVAYSPQLLLSPLNFSQVALGWNHALLLTVDGEVFMFGGTLHGMLSNPQQASLEEKVTVLCTQTANSDTCLSPVLAKVPGLDGMKVIHISAGAEHSALVTEHGLVMTWGWGEHGMLGLGDTSDRTSPHTVRLGTGPSSTHAQFRIYCGSGFTFAVSWQVSTKMNKFHCIVQDPPLLSLEDELNASRTSLIRL